ncbi:MAG: YHYH domain-containing protein [Ruminococcaceae bacterium]|nr:YHYH domain-containing protein [Oscillospiraceae bacterium]
MKRKIIKGIFAVIVLLCLCLSCGLVVSAHPGDTDEYGGHYDRETGDYHYHHGYPPHSHKDGVCPYDFNDRTGWNSGSSSGSTVQTTTNSSVTTTHPKTTYSYEYEDDYEDGYDDGYEDGYDAREYQEYLEDKGIYSISDLEEYRKKAKRQDILEKILINGSIILAFTWLPLVFLFFYIKFLINKISQKIKDRKIHKKKEQQPPLVGRSKQAKAQYSDWHYAQIRYDLMRKICTTDGNKLIPNLPQDVYIKKPFNIAHRDSSCDLPYGVYTVFIQLSTGMVHANNKCEKASYAHCFSSYRANILASKDIHLCPDCWESTNLQDYEDLFSPQWYKNYQQIYKEIRQNKITDLDLKRYCESHNIK